jgi:ABC-2 type transport system ATP-binding protein
MSSEKILDIKDISKNFKRKKVLNNINFSINKGEIFGLIGVNGIGKTTLIKMILDLLKADQGEISIFNKSSLLKDSRSLVSYLPEKFHPSGYLKGKEFLSLSMGYFNKKYDADKVLYYADALDLDLEVLNKNIMKYSKGMGQKLGLMSMFLSEAPLLILDEPMSGLDPHVRIRLKDLLKSYVKKGNTVFFSSHILSDIDEICHRVGVINQQKLAFLGTATEFKKQYEADSLERAFLKIINK